MMEGALIAPASARAELMARNWARTILEMWMAEARAYVARALLAGAERVDLVEVERRFRDRVSEATTQAVMAVMDQQGIDHCKICPTRVGLMKRSGDLLCEKHGRDIR